MTANDYLYVYANDKEDRYHHLPPLDIAIKISRILSKDLQLKILIKIVVKCWRINSTLLIILLEEIQYQERFELIV
jgi:hypothetical protein